MSTSWDGDREEYDTVPLYVLWNAPGLYYLTVIFPGKSYTLTVLLVRRIFFHALCLKNGELFP